MMGAQAGQTPQLTDSRRSAAIACHYTQSCLMFLSSAGVETTDRGGSGNWASSSSQGFLGFSKVLGPDFLKILRQSYDNLRSFVQYTLILRQIYDIMTIV